MQTHTDIIRKKSKKINIGDISIGGCSPITVQSMTNTDTRDINSTVEQIKQLEDAGCDIVRLAVPDMEAAEALKSIVNEVRIPVVADIHFDYRLAVASINNGVDKVRLNPGNIGNTDRVAKVVNTAKKRNIPIRIGVNSGSLEHTILKKYNGITPEGMVESALNHVRILEKLNYDRIVISLKSSSVPMTISVYRMMSERTEYPLHLGVTEAGTIYEGTVKSSVAIGCLLAEGIGDTIRVSLTGSPVEEIKAGQAILKSLKFRQNSIELVSCPTCGRCNIDLISIANEIENRTKNMNKKIKVAVMGCVVNGPGEAKDADIGIAGGKNESLLFKKGKIIRKTPNDKIVDELMDEILKMPDNKQYQANKL